MKTNPKTESPSRTGGRSPKPEGLAQSFETESVECVDGGMRLLTTEDVAVVLKVSVRTVERMLHDGEIKPVRLRGSLVRFRLEDVMEAVRNQGRKWGRRAVISHQPSVASNVEKAQRTDRSPLPPTSDFGAARRTQSSFAEASEDRGA